MKKYKIAILFSGGLDSSATLIKALEKTKEVLLCFFNYGQNSLDHEEQALKLIADKYEVSYTTFDVTNLSQYLSCSITTGDKDKGDAGFSSTVPNRNLLFLTLLSSYCQTCEIPYIFTGFQFLLGKTGEKVRESSLDDKIGNIIDKVNNSLYTEHIHSDQKPEFITSAKRAIYYSTDKKVQIVTPLIDMDKVDILQYLESKGELKFITNNSYTCYNGSNKKNSWGIGCGKCTACENRQRAYTIFEKNYGGKI